jgi:hypothetical protein
VVVDPRGDVFDWGGGASSSSASFCSSLSDSPSSVSSFFFARFAFSLVAALAPGVLSAIFRRFCVVPAASSGPLALAFAPSTAPLASGVALRLRDAARGDAEVAFVVEDDEEDDDGGGKK